jgi:hypothetical protein
LELIKKEIDLFGNHCMADLMEFNKRDTQEWISLWNSWKTLKMGLRNYKSREPNLPEGLSETAYCMYSGSHRLIEIYGNCNRSADTYNLISNEAEQIKATSVEDDLTSFGPKTKWDKLYFLDFYRDGSLNGSFDIYEIDKNLIYNTIVNKGKNETFKDQQLQGRRPRMSLKKLIKENGIIAKDKNICIWK